MGHFVELGLFVRGLAGITDKFDEKQTTERQYGAGWVGGP